MASEGKILL